MRHRIAGWLIAILGMSGGLAAEGLFDGLALHGFVSQGAFLTTNNNFLPNSKNVTFELNEVGFTLSKQLTPKLRVGFQFLSRDWGDLGNNDVVLDWGFADYRFADAFGIRAGKVKLPFGLYNESRDVDQARPMILLPQSIYDDTKRDIFVGYEGVGVYGSLRLGKGGSLDYSAGTGANRFRSDAMYFRYFTNLWNLMMLQRKLPSRTITGLDMTTKSFFTGQVMWNTPLEGLRVGATLVDFKGRMNQVNGPAEVGTWTHKGWYTLSGEFVWRDLTLASEYSQTETDIALFGLPLMKDKVQQGFYVLGSYQLSGRMAVSALYDVYYVDKDDKEGTNYLRNGMPDHMAWRKDFGAGLRYDVNRNLTLKAEWHAIDGTALFLSVYNSPYDPVSGMGKTTLEPKWNLFGLKASYSF